MFKCECGKEFEQANSFNAHKSHCKAHYIAKYGNLDYFYTAHKQRSLKAGKTQQLNHQQAIETDLAAWVSEKHVCERCGKLMTEKFGSGRFCSRACANSHEHTTQSREKVSQSLKNSYKQRRNAKHDEQLSLKLCKVCGKMLKTSNKTGYCSVCLRHSDACFEIRSKQSIATRDRLRAEGRQFGFPSRKVTSYPEQFFEKVLTNNGIEYIREFKVTNDHGCCYFLDFLIEVNGNKIDLEIDGQQHLEQERIESDRRRDDYLSKDYIVYRIA